MAITIVRHMRRPPRPTPGTRLQMSFVDPITGAQYIVPIYIGSAVSYNTPAPLMIWHHGDGGNGTDGLTHITGSEQDAYVTMSGSNWTNFISVFPQNPSLTSRYPLWRIYPELISRILTQYNIDRKRIHLGGVSRGMLAIGTFLSLYLHNLVASISCNDGGCVAGAVDSFNQIPTSLTNSSATNVLNVNGSRHLGNQQLCTMLQANNIAFWETHADGDTTVPHDSNYDGLIPGRPDGTTFSADYNNYLLSQAGYANYQYTLSTGGQVHGWGAFHTLANDIGVTPWRTFIANAARTTDGYL